MTQKDKVKELVGRGLHSYHTKALQQMDRIEKKNKEQNHKISILTNELDNDYLTKTEEGSVISLEHSKEGMVYLDELQGNTLVNYCTDGSKEMTLNGDIDVEGTFVTTTEGVDNGLVDVMCEGNTLVNLCKLLKISNNVAFLDNPTRICGTVTIVNAFKANEVYVNRYNISDGTYAGATLVTSNVFKLDIPTGQYLGQLYDNTTTDFIPPSTLIEDVLILEGDWTDREIPPYFEGMKSVGQDDENGHKIEILSRNKNLFDINSWKGATVSSGQRFDINNNTVTILGYNSDTYTKTGATGSNVCSEGERKYLIEVKPNTTYTLSMEVEGETSRVNYVQQYNENYANLGLVNYGSSTNDKVTFTTKPNCKYVGFRVGVRETGATLVYSNILLEEGSQKTNYVNYNTNKKEILLNEPLRGLSNGIKDRFVKIDNKWFIERNRGIREYQEGDLDLTDVITDMTNTEYSLEVPIYEPLEINPELICYNDTTHISNNSIIPCNMKIKNSGYNAIIKPSTLYTVALDTNKSGTIGMNLGGAKGTTTNNVATITTPVTLTDDSLRIYGKGIKGSKVRLLEGDKTNWIPSHFEGMKSSFEDKLQDDGTYKMEILSNNENLIDMFSYRTGIRDNQEIIEDKNNNSITVKCNNMGTYNKISYRLYLKEGEKIYVSYKGTRVTAPTNQSYFDFKRISNGDWYITGTSNPNGMVVTANRGTGYYDFNFYFSGSSVVETNTVTFKDIMISKVDNNFVLHKSNKIQFSSIEPLRKWDRFVFNDGQLMVERCSKNITFNGSEPWSFNNTDGTTTNRYFLQDAFLGGTEGQDIENTLCDKLQTYQWNQTAILGITRNHTSAFVYNKNITNLKDFKSWLSENNLNVTYRLSEPTYEEIPYELQKIILEGYENGTLFFDTNIPPTSTVTYAGETPIVKSVKLNKTEVLNNTTDINDNIIPYLMDMDYRVVCLELATETQGISMARLFGGVYEMLQRDIQSRRYSVDEYKHRLDAYLGANKITHEEYNKLGDMLNE